MEVAARDDGDANGEPRVGRERQQDGEPARR